MHDVAVIGARGFGGALCARIVDRHPSLRLVAATARDQSGQRHDELYARYGVKTVLEEFDPELDRRTGRRRRSWPIPTRPRPAR